MLKKYLSVFLIVGLAIAAAVWAVFVPAQRDMAAMLAGLFGMIGAVSAFLTWPGAAPLVDGRERSLIVIGWAVCGVAGVGGIAGSFLAGLYDPTLMEPIIYVSVLVGMGGYMITRLPAMLTQVARSKVEVAAAKGPTARRADFDAIREGLAAPIAVLRGLPFLLQIAGPWVVLLAGGAYAILSWPHPAGADSNAAWRLLSVVMVLLAGLYVVLPSVLVAWTRRMIDGRTPKWIVAMPDRASFGFAWRIWISLTVLGVADQYITTPLTRIVSSAAPSVAGLAETLIAWSVALLVVMLFSSMSLVLPAIAVGDKQFDRSAALVRGRKLWPGLPLGLALSLAPIPLAAWAVSSVIEAVTKSSTPQMPGAQHALTASDLVWLVAWILVMLATLISGMTFLTRAYQAAKDTAA